jgi:hypothetical protein
LEVGLTEVYIDKIGPLKISIAEIGAMKGNIISKVCLVQIRFKSTLRTSLGRIIIYPIHLN